MSIHITDFYRIAKNIPSGFPDGIFFGLSLFDKLERVSVHSANGANGSFAFGYFKILAADRAMIFCHNVSPFVFDNKSLSRFFSAVKTPIRTFKFKKRPTP